MPSCDRRPGAFREEEPLRVARDSRLFARLAACKRKGDEEWNAPGRPARKSQPDERRNEVSPTTSAKQSARAPAHYRCVQRSVRTFQMKFTIFHLPPTRTSDTASVPQWLNVVPLRNV